MALRLEKKEKKFPRGSVGLLLAPKLLAQKPKCAAKAMPRREPRSPEHSPERPSKRPREGERQRKTSFNSI